MYGLDNPWKPMSPQILSLEQLSVTGIKVLPGGGGHLRSFKE